MTIDNLLAAELVDRQRPVRARAAYAELVDPIHADDWAVENYQMPVIADERRFGSSRLLGLVDLRTECKVWMQYTSFLRGRGRACPGPTARSRPPSP